MTGAWGTGGEIRPIRQTEAAECGLASLAMVANHFGHKVNLGGLRQRFPPSMKGATLAQLMDIATALDLSPRAIRLEIDEARQLRTPAIVHWDFVHYVVLEHVAADGSWTIVDPAAGRRRLPASKVSAHFTGVALELSPAANFRPIVARTTTRLSDLWSRITNFRKALTQVLVLSLVLQFTALLMPFYLQVVVDQAIAVGDSSLLLLLLAGFGIIFALNSVVRALREWVMLTFGQSLSFDLGGNVVRHLIRLPLAYFERRHVGDLMSRVGSIQPIQALLTRGLVNLVIDSMLFVITFVVMMAISPMLSLIVLASTLAYLGYSQLLYPQLRQRSEEEIIARAGEETFLMETIRSIRAVKLHAHEAQRESGWRNQYAEVISASYRSRLLDIRVSLVESLLSNGAFLLCVYLGAARVIDNAMTVGTLLAFLAYRGNFVASASSLVDQAQRWRLMGLHLERLSDIVTEAKEEIAPPPARLRSGPPSLALEQLGFAYDRGDVPIIRQADLQIPAGAFVALIGPSGAGKTTLFRLLLGLAQPDSGGVLVDGAPLSPATMAQWRARVGAVMQDDCLLTGTIADNIAFFDPAADRERIAEAARQAEIAAEIERMPMGYDSLIGDMGAALSAGQRQRIFLARALYRRPDILFLDEGTANLDPATETRIADTIAALPITRIVIAHRPALVERADMVVTLEQGQLVVGSRVAAPAASFSPPFPDQIRRRA
ncbi:MAG: peptidase domain-containing ABC transporter [Proteobacteria bacterium]|nr:peptidase domain-containing ABC transporter [Pseudomonadota bacterium]